MSETGAPPHPRREHRSLTAAAEKRLLVWLAQRMPRSVNSDHLTALGLAGNALAGLGYALSGRDPRWLHFVNLCLVVNWFGDSLDGTLARVRHHERPRYGFYVDHVLDALGILFIIAGLVLGGFMSPLVGAGFLLAYYLLTIEIALATYAVGTFRISFWKFGPTELRILLAAGTLQLLRSETVSIFGSEWLLFDVGCIVAIAGLLVTFIVAAVMNTRTLYRAEPLPQRGVDSSTGSEQGTPRPYLHDAVDPAIP